MKRSLHEGHCTRAPRHPRRQNVPNLSPTRPPACPADAALWPSWADVPVHLLNLDAFDGNGNPIAPDARKGAC